MKHVARWWKYKTQHQQDAQPAVIQWYESGLRLALSSMAQASTQQEDKCITLQPKQTATA